jgi:hypothetical protein
VVKLLVDAMEKQLRNAKSKDEEDTALHIAAGNRNVSREFLSQLADVDPLLRNKNKDTAFHVAARSEKSDVILHMLHTFARVDISDVDADRTKERPKSLMDICVDQCNVEAVVALLQRGAELGHGIMHRVIHNSVEYPHRIEGCRKVYRALVEHSFVFWCFEERSEKFQK